MIGVTGGPTRSEAPLGGATRSEAPVGGPTRSEAPVGGACSFPPVAMLEPRSHTDGGAARVAVLHAAVSCGSPSTPALHTRPVSHSGREMT